MRIVGRAALLAFLLAAALPVALMLSLTAPMLHATSPNRGWTLNLKPGSIITLEELRILEERGWRLVRADVVYRYYGVTLVYGSCRGAALLVAGRGVDLPIDWSLMKPVAGRPPVENLTLSTVAEATVYYKPARLLHPRLAYCLEKINKTAYRVTGLLKHAYIGAGRGKPYRIIVTVDHEKFEEVLRREWVSATRALLSPADAHRLNQTLRITWTRVEKHVGGATIELDVPVIHAPRMYGLTYPHTYMRLVVAPLLKLLGDPLWLSRGQLWLHYNLSNVYDPYPPNWLVYGGVCGQYAIWSVIMALILNDTHVYNLDIPGADHASAVYCSGRPVYFSGPHGGYYGLLAVGTRTNRTLICWLWGDTGYAAEIWERIPRLGAWIRGYRLTGYHTLEPLPGERYRVVKTWVGRRVPRTAYNATAG